ncbi:MAG: hypothetical protein AAGF11_31135 [Myxococcota bacterium]
MNDDPTDDPTAALTTDLDAWVCAYRQVRRPSPARRAAIRAAIAEASAIEDQRSQRNRRLGVGLLVAAGLGAALLLGRLLEHQSMRPNESVEEPGIAPYSATVGHEPTPVGEREPPSPAPASEPAPEPAPEPGDTESTRPSPAPQREAIGERREPRRHADRADRADRADNTASSPDPSRTPLELESMRMLREAERRLETTPAASLELLRQHARRFPTSSLKLEREALTVIALCRTGRSTEGRKRQQAFLSAHGTSAYASRVRRACPSPTPASSVPASSVPASSVPASSMPASPTPASPTPASPTPSGRTSHSN